SVHFRKVEEQCRFQTAVFGHVGNHHCGSDAHAFQQPSGLGEVCVRQSTAPFCQRCGVSLQVPLHQVRSRPAVAVSVEIVGTCDPADQSSEHHLPPPRPPPHL